MSTTAQIVDYIINCPAELNKLAGAIIQHPSFFCNDKLCETMGKKIIGCIPDDQITVLAARLCKPLECECNANGPEAVDDSYITTINAPIEILALQKDMPSSKHCPLDPETLVIEQAPVNGVAVIDLETSTITYTPNVGFVGQDLFIYKIEDECCNCDKATVFITVEEANLPPVCVNGLVTMDRNSVIEIELSTNVTKGTCDIASYEIVTGIVNGVGSIDGTTLTYEPNEGFVGVEDITIRVVDECDEECEFVISVNVQATAVALPVCANDIVNITYNSGANVINVIANDTSDPLCPLIPETVAIMQTPLYGTVDATAQDGTITYTAPTGWAGTVTFVYSVHDECGQMCVGTVTVNVAPPCAYQVLSTASVTLTHCSAHVFTLNQNLLCPDTNQVLVWVANAQGYLTPYTLKFESINNNAVAIDTVEFMKTGSTKERVMAICCGPNDPNCDC